MDVTESLELRYRPWLVLLWGFIAAVQTLLIVLTRSIGGSLWLRIAAAVIAAGAAVVLSTGRLKVDHHGVEQRGVMGRREVRWGSVEKVVLDPTSRFGTVKVVPRGRAPITAGTAIWQPTTPGRLEPAVLATALNDLAVAAAVPVERVG